MPGDIGVSATFNVSDLTPFDFDEDLMDSRASPFQEGGTDDSSDPSSPKIVSSTYQDEILTTSSRVDQPSCISKNGPDHLIGIGGPMTRARTRKMNEALTQLLIDIHKETQSKLPEPSTRFVHILARKLESISSDARVLPRVDLPTPPSKVDYPKYSTR